jgi:hypothetical protein
MSAETLLLPPVGAPPAAGFVRVEYLGFQNAAEHREFRLRVCGPEGSTEIRMCIAFAAFGAGRVRMQDGPDVCYQKLLRAVAAGETASLVTNTIDDVELASYREAHTKVPKHRAGWVPLPPAPTVAPWKQRRPSAVRLPVAPLVADDREPELEEGQRVSHAIFGFGVTTSSNGGHTIVRFDEGDGPRTFVTSMLKVEVLSAPRTWETTPRGRNRLRRTPAPPASSPA